ncbi:MULTISPECIES: hypothetical protein [Shewanella]|jgi:hypothetical protein|uniref:Uncharacterized protein n=1 Tax=Shewanella psychromarinicola TaxID=2487742 RepID=A0A3N4E443_9GAMM|nr:hypothetical protein [Shewanella psychromarinicola]AZG35233.1 hypothetical protein EGC80_10060 [Shewanella psychromarinicola]MCL1082610.1 hypothetical protein [Shewanella psychromarinicola]RPA32965.1 hypothetical protein EGC77_06265 [Shewanella psychromarinicola]
MTDISSGSTHVDEAKIPVKPHLPKRLIGLMIIYTLAAISGLMAVNSISELSAMLCILTLMMVLAIIGRQKAGLYLLRVYCVLQLLLYSVLPIIMYDPDNLVAGPTTFDFGFFQTVVADWVIYSVLIALGIIQVWISFNAKVKAWFKPRMNLNIMSS